MPVFFVLFTCANAAFVKIFEPDFAQLISLPTVTPTSSPYSTNDFAVLNNMDLLPTSVASSSFSVSVQSNPATIAGGGVYLIPTTVRIENSLFFVLFVLSLSFE
jgi:hypothetical protein